MRKNSILRVFSVSCVMSGLLFLAACGGSEPENHARVGSVWDQAFSQAMETVPAKGGE